MSKYVSGDQATCLRPHNLRLQILPDSFQHEVSPKECKILNNHIINITATFIGFI